MNVAPKLLLQSRVVYCFLSLLILIFSQVNSPAAAAGEFRFTSATYDASEFGGTVLITVTRTGEANGRVSVDYSITEGTALVDVDYLTNTVAKLFFDHFQMSASFSVAILDDGGIAQPSRDFNIQLTNAVLLDPDADAGLNPPTLHDTLSNATVNILDIDTDPETEFEEGVIFNFVEPRLFVDEGGGVSVGVIRTGTNSEACSVEVRVQLDRSYFLYPGSDYASADDCEFNVATVSWAKDDYRIKRVAVTTLQDLLVEFNEDIRLTLSNGSAGSIPGAVDEMTVTIAFDDQSSGAADKTFNQNNSAGTSPPFNSSPGANGSVYAIAVQTNSYYIGGDFTSYNTIPRNRLARVQANGQLDPSFSPGSGANAFITDVELDANGAVVIGGGFSSFNGTQRNSIARVNNNGSLDTSFNPGLGVNGVVWALAVEANGIFVAGDFTTVNGTARQNLAKLNNDGSLNSIFNASPAINGSIFAAALQPDGKVIIGGEFTSVGGAPRGGIARFNINGSLDMSFDPGVGLDNAVYALAIQTDGKILAGGAFSTANALESKGIARFLPNGSIDDTFDPGTGTDDTVYSIRTEENGTFWMGGVFTSYNGTRRLGIARVLGSGYLDTTTLDTGYNQYAGLPNQTYISSESFVLSVALVNRQNSTNGVLIGGGFNRVGGGATRTAVLPRRNFAQLVGGASPGPGNVGFTSQEYTADEEMSAVFIQLERSNGKVGSAGARFNPQTLPFEPGVSELGSDFEFQDILYGTPIFLDQYQGLNNLSQTTSDDVYIGIFDDQEVEGNEVQQLRLTEPFGTDIFLLGGENVPLGTALARSKATLTIVDNDSPRSVISFSASDFYVNENDGTATITLTRSNNIGTSVQVQYRTGTNGSATLGSDYTAANGTVTFNPSQTTRTFTVPIINDSSVELDETISLHIVGVSNGALFTVGQATLHIVDNDVPAGRVNFSLATYNANENTGQVPITVTRTGGSSGSLSVQFIASNLVVNASNAVPGIDYIATNGVISWNSGESTPKNFMVKINNNQNVDGTRKVNLKISSPSSGTNSLGAITEASLYLIDDDAYGSFAFNASKYFANDNGGAVTLTVVRGFGIAGQASVNYTFTNGTAVNGVHFTGVNGSLVFPPGVSSTNITVPIQPNDGTSPGNVEFRVLLSSPSPAGAVLGTPSTAVVTIVDHNLFNQPAGSVDTGFAPSPGANNFIYAIASQGDGKILTGGDFTIIDGHARARIARLTTNSALDVPFSGPTLGANSTIRSIAVQNDGRILVVGNFTNLNGTHLNYIGRLNANGLLDSSFNPGSAADDPIYSVAETFVDGQRKVLIGGGFSTFNGSPRNAIARLNNDGGIDVTFAPSLGADGTVYAVVPYPASSVNAGKVIIGGDFTNVNGQTRNRIARLNADGSLDQTFNPGAGANGSVRTIAIQPDGRILVGGLFTFFAEQVYNYIVRLDATGAVDAQFQIGTGASDSVYVIALQNDGKVLLGGEFTTASGVTRQRITRLRPDGTVDPSINFGTGANGFISAMLVQPDGKIIVAGGFSEFDGFPRGGIARLHGGTLSGSGAIEFTKGDYNVIESTNATVQLRRRGGTAQASVPVTVQFSTSDGTASSSDYISVTSNVSFPEGETLKSIVIPIVADALIESDETVNLTLSNPTGTAIIANQPTATLTIANDDSAITFSASTYRRQENAIDGAATVSVIRKGSVLGTSSVRVSTTRLGSASPGVDYAEATAILVFLPGETNKTLSVTIFDDSIIEGDETVSLELSSLTNSQPGDFMLATLTIADDDFSPGTISFSQSSYLTTEGTNYVAVTLIRTNGSTGVVGVNYTTIDGSASAGTDYTSVSGPLVFSDSEVIKTINVPILQDVIVEGNETFLIQISNPVGGAIISGPTQLSVVIEDDEFGPGSLDRSFNPGTGANNLVKTLAVQTDGNVVIGGAFTAYDGTNRNYLARLTANGRLDRTFNPGSAANAIVSSVGILPGGRIAVAGAFTTFNGSSLNRVARINTNGTVDTSFSQPTGLNSAVNALALQADGKLVLGGAFSLPTVGAARLTSSGSSDNGFGVGSGTDGPVHAAVVQTDGNIVIAGDFDLFNGVESPGVARIHTDGLMDQSFNGPNFSSGRVYAAAVQFDGKIILGGDFVITDGTLTKRRIARLNVDGTIDSTFATGNGPNDTVYAVTLQNNGKVIIGGDFTNVAGEGRNRIARLNYDGTFDFSFDPGSGANGTVYNIRLLTDGKLLIVGDFTSVNGLTRNGIARLNGDNVRPHLSAQDIVEGQLHLSIQTIPTYSYQLQTSPDLVQWTAIATHTAPGNPSNGTLWDYNETIDQLSTNRFYRVLQLNP